MQIEFVGAASGAAVVAVFVQDERKLSKGAQAYDQQCGGALARAIGAGRFTGAKGQTLLLTAPAGASAPAILAIGVGAKDGFDDLALEHAAGQAYSATKLLGFDTLAIEVSDLSAEQAARAGFAARLASYRFDKYLTKQPADKKPSITKIELVAADAKAAQAAYGPLSAVADGVFFARDLVAEPANVLYPEEFARRCKGLEKLGLSVEVLGEAEMEMRGMRTLLAVGMGSTKDSQLVVMCWNGAADKNAQPIAFVGKGVCFDSGGLSLKPPEAMEDMKWDMGGGGAVAGLMCALAGRKAKANVVGVIGLVENMPDGNAQRPGAVVVALGDEIAGVFSNSDELADNLLAASKATGEPLWRMPLPASYERMIDSPTADIKNTGKGRLGGASSAALFLQRFTNGVPWAHLDIAPVAWRKDPKVSTVPDGPAGFGVFMLVEI